ncbi:MAG TPA: relaxase/mobilization nuclease domain-containing protein [Thermoanaerobaculia bacterium]|nr:relaxase/mobilization nuclease domain-containing protein [Thermoanaerobaculia bacterium]
MIGKIIKGSGFRGLLNYLASKPGAEIIGGNMEGKNPRELAREFGFVRQLHPRLGKAVFHLPLRLSYEEQLDPEQWRHVADRMLAGLGFAGAPYVLYRHPHDQDGHHVHIVASRVNYLGDVVPDSMDFERAMRIERRIEADYGLRVVPCPKVRARAAPQRERQKLAKTLEPSVRDRLQRAVAAAAAPSRTVGEFVAELERKGVAVRPQIISTGAVAGIRYRLGSLSFTGSGLGSAYTWPGLLNHFRLDFQPQRDLPILLAAGERFGQAPAGAPPAAASAGASAAAAPSVPPSAAANVAAPSAGAPAGAPAGGPRIELPDAPAASPHDQPRARQRRQSREAATPSSHTSPRGSAAPSSPEVPMPDSSGPPAAAAPPPSAPPDRTSQEVQRQLAALASPRYDVLVLDAATGAHRHLRGAWTPEQVLAAAGWLKHQNAQGGEILIRPVAPLGYCHLAGVGREALQAAREAGFEPAAVVRAPDGSREVWLRAGIDIAPHLQGSVQSTLARRFRAVRTPAVPGYGHLAGFTSPLAQRTADLARPPFLSLDEAAGRSYRAAREVVKEAAKELAGKDLSDRLERELAHLSDLLPPRPAAAADRAAEPAASPSPEIRDALRALDADALRRGLAVTPPGRDELASEVGRIERARHEYAVAHQALGGVDREDPALRDAAAARTVAAFQALRLAEDGLAERLGVQTLPARLDPARLDQLARRHATLLRAEARLGALEAEPAAEATDRLEAAIAVRTLRAELADLAARQGCKPSLAEERLHDAASREADQEAANRGVGAAAPAPAAPADQPLAARGQARTPAEAAPAALPDLPLDSAEDPPLERLYRIGRPLRVEELETVLDFGTAEPPEHEAALPATAGRPWGGAGVIAPDAGLRHETELLAAEAALGRHERTIARRHEQTCLALDDLEPAVERDPSPQNLSSYDGLLTRLVELDERLAVARETRDAIAFRRLTLSLERQEWALERQPSAEGFSAYARQLDERWQAASRLRPEAHRRDATGFRRLPAPSEAELATAKGRVRESIDRLLAAPSRQALATAARDWSRLRAGQRRGAEAAATRELRTARNELRRAGDWLLDAARAGSGESPSPVRLGKWSAALARYRDAEARFAARLDRALPAAIDRPDDFNILLRRLGRGDRTAETLAALQRALAHQLRSPLGRATPPGRDARPAPVSLLDAIAAYRADRAALLAAARRLTAAHVAAWQDGRRAAPSSDLERLRAALGRYQSSRARLAAKTAERPRGPERGESGLVPVQHFLAHPGFAAAPHRAVAAWSAHARRQGVAPERIPDVLAASRAPRQARTAAPRVLSPGRGMFRGGGLYHLIFLAYGAGREYAHER